MSKLRELTLLDKARRALAEATDIDEIRDIIDRAEALRLYWKKAEDGLEIQNRAAEVKIRAERRAGEILSEMEKARAGRPKKNRSLAATNSSAFTYAELGINKSQASRWQQIASLSTRTFEKHVSGQDPSQCSRTHGQ